MTSSFSLTSHLLALAPETYKSATQSPFLLAAAEGRLSKKVLGRWLANDRLYIHAYIRAAGKMIAELDLPVTVPESETAETRLVDWLVEALAGVRREERFFVDVAGRYGLGIGLEVLHPISDEVAGTMGVQGKLEGLVMLEGLFGEVGWKTEKVGVMDSNTPTVLPWLEAAVVFWATERCYLDAWTWAKERQLVRDSEGQAHEDADGGALRKEFIPNWSSEEFAGFVGRLGSIIDEAVGKMVEGPGGEEVKAELLRRVEGNWKSLLAAEAAFWPELD